MGCCEYLRTVCCLNLSGYISNTSLRAIKSISKIFNVIWSAPKCIWKFHEKQQSCFTVTEPLPELWISFSAYNNLKKLVTTSKKPYHLLYLNGIKVISMFWVCVSHSYLTSMYGPTNNEMDIIKVSTTNCPNQPSTSHLQWVKTPFALCMISASMALDTFLLMGGLLTVYTYLRKRDYGLKFSVAMYYTHRFVRWVFSPRFPAFAQKTDLMKRKRRRFLCGRSCLWRVIIN